MATTKVQSELIVDDVALAGNPTTSTQSAGNNTTRIATTAFVTTAVNNLIDSAPGTMDTLNEIAAALNDDANFNTTVTNAIATKAPLASPALTGTVTAASHVQIAGNLDVVGQIGAYDNPGSSWGAMGLRATDYTFKNAGGTVKLTIDASGNATFAGIVQMTKGGTLFTPLSYDGLVIQNGDATGIRIIDAGDGGGNGGHVGIGNDNGNLQLSTAGEMLFDTGFEATDQVYAGRHEKMRITSGGHVGIGTGASPRYNLTVAGTSTTAIGIGLDNASGSSTLDIAALGTGYNNHQAAAGEVWFFSPDTINIGGATGHTNDVKFIANNTVNMIIKGANGRVGIGVTGPTANLQINGSTDAGGVSQNMLIKNLTTASFSSTAFVGTGRVLDFFTNSNDSQDFSAIRFTNPGGSRETAIAVVADQVTTRDGTLQGDVVIQGYDGDGYIETQRFRANGASSSTGQRRTGSYTSFAYINHTYTFEHAGYSTAGTPANSNDHWLEVPLYSSYSSSAGGGWVEMDICWHASHAQAGHLHSYKIVWGSNHGRILNISVVSSSANATSGSYAPYAFTSSSRLYRHPTASDANMVKMYIEIKGSTNHSGARSITLRGVGHPSVKNLAPIIDHGSDSTPDSITPTSVTSAITATG